MRVCMVGLLREGEQANAADEGPRWYREPGDPHGEASCRGESNASSAKPDSSNQRRIWRLELGLERLVGPDDGGARSTQLRQALDGGPGVGGRNAAEDAAEQDEVGGNRTGIGIGYRCVPADDLDVPVEPELLDELAGRRHVARVELDQPRTDVGLARMSGDDRKELPALARADADDPDPEPCSRSSRKALICRWTSSVRTWSLEPGSS